MHGPRRRTDRPASHANAAAVSAALRRRWRMPRPRRKQGINSVFGSFRTISGVLPLEFPGLFRGLQENSLPLSNRELNRPVQGMIFARSAKQSRKTANALSPVFHGRQRSPKRFSCSSQSRGTPSRKMRATDRAGDWRPSRMARCRRGARQAMGSRVRM